MSPTLSAAEPVRLSEQQSDQASALLTRIAHHLADPSRPEPIAPPVIAPSLTVDPFQPPALPTTAQGAGLIVKRWPAARPEGTRRSLEEAISLYRRELLSPEEPWTSRVKVKTTHIHADTSAPQKITTRSLVALTFATPRNRREYSAEWEAQWGVPNAAEPLKLQLTGLHCLGGSETTSAQAAPWLSDMTAALLGKVPWFKPQMLYGNPWWRARLQKDFEHFVYGHRGLAIGDANGDGLDDVYLCEEGGLPNRLLLQNADGSVTDASASSGSDIMEMSRAAVFADLDNDGDEDLALTLGHGLLMLENMGQANFRQRTLLPRIGDGFGLSVADYDNDGWLDLYVCNYLGATDDPARLPYPAPFFDARNGGTNYLIRNEGNWRFANATDETGLGAVNDRFSFGAVWTDINNDRWLDLLVINDFGHNNLFIQQRDPVTQKITFRDELALRGMATGAFGMAATIADVNRDGRLDIYTANMFSSAGLRLTGQADFRLDAKESTELPLFRNLARGNSLFLNEGNTFSDVSEAAGVAMGRWSWGTHFADMNHDTWPDLLVANGNITGHTKDPDL